MSIIPNSVAVPAQSKSLDTSTVTTAAGLVHRQVISLADPENQGQYARLTGNALNVQVVNTSLAITATTLPLPSGAATESTLSAANLKLNALDGVTNKDIGTQITTSDIGLVTNTVIHGLSTGGGGYVDVKVTPSGAVVTDTGLDQPLTNAQLRTVGEQVAVRDYGMDAARGLITGVSFVTIRGYNQATSTTSEPIWAQSGTAYPNPTTAQTLTVSSTSAVDTGAGTGARTVFVRYIQASNGAEVTATVTLNGTTAVTVSADCIAVNDLRVITAGTGGQNAGTIFAGYGTVTLGTPANVLSTIAVGRNAAQQAIYTVPAGKVLEIMAFRLSASVLSFIQLRIRANATAVQTVEFDIPLATSVSFNSVAPSTFAAGTRIQFNAQTAAGAGAAGCIISGFLRSV